MASNKSYSITLSNNRTEKSGIDYLMAVDSSFLNPSRESRKKILELLDLPSTFSRAFDLLQIQGHTNSESEISENNKNKITLIELKTTQKYLPNAPKGFFFGATQNEFDLAERLGSQFKFCFVCLHPKSYGFHLTSLDELNSLIRTKRTQFQINL